MSEEAHKSEEATPAFPSRAFRCPHCKQFARQNWGQCGATYEFYANGGVNHCFDIRAHDVFFSKCDACENLMVWKDKKIVWPQASPAPEAHTDFPAEIRSDYEEARAIFNASPRASAALLRLCLQKLCKHLGATGEHINSDIQFLYDEYGLGRRVRDSMDILRVVGNNAVHPGEIDLNDSIEISLGLFRIINFVVDKAISEPAHIDSIFSQLPEGAKEAIERRGQNSKNSAKPPIDQPEH